MKKKIISLIIIFIVAASIMECGTQEKDNLEKATTEDNLTVSQSVESTDTENPKSNDEYSVINKFIELYNDSATNTITDISEMDIHGEDYRTEFRLNAFKKAVGKNGVISGSTINIINYGNFGNNSLRIYITAPTDDIALDVYTTTIHIFDDTITENEMMEEFGVNGIYLGENGCIGGYVNGNEIMLDCTNLNFMND